MEISTASTALDDFNEFERLVAGMQEFFATSTAAVDGAPKRLVRMDCPDLFDVFLAYLPPERRQDHNCSCCRSFFKRYGSLATISAEGVVEPALFSPSYAPTVYHRALQSMASSVRHSPVKSAFYSSEAVLGTIEAGGFQHLHVKNPHVHSEPLRTAGQKMAKSLEDFRTLRRALLEYNTGIVMQAVSMLRSGAFYRSEKILAQAEFFLGLKNRMDRLGSGAVIRNVIWSHVVGAPEGWCQPRSTMLGTLLDDIKDGAPVDETKRKFAAKMDPLKYQRPTAAPRDGNIDRAEEIIQKLGLEKSLRRRYAKFEEIQKIWVPKNTQKNTENNPGIFSELRGSRKNTQFRPGDGVNGGDVTWRKFAETVLPVAQKMEVYTIGHMYFAAMVTAVHADAPPILEWDHLERRNPVSWYLYPGGSAPSVWSLPTAEWVDVTGVTLLPWQWTPGKRTHNSSIMFLLGGAKDTNRTSSALFPEILRGELHEVRQTIEAHSRRSIVEGREEATACGVLVPSNCRIRVTTDVGIVFYTIDRLE